MVGTARFELATSRTPSVRATRLRYVPTGTETATWKRPIPQGLKPREIWLRNVAAKAATHKRTQGSESQHLQGYHRRSRSVKKACNASRKSSSILRLNNCDPPSPE